LLWLTFSLFSPYAKQTEVKNFKDFNRSLRRKQKTVSDLNDWNLEGVLTVN